MTDYSGEFLPNLKLNDFSHDTLADLLALYSKLYIALDGFWYLTIKERLGNEEALACDMRTWEIMSKYEMAKITKQLNIQGNDVIALMKAMQIAPWFRHIEHETEVRNPDDAIITVSHCATLDALEREGEGREDQICNMVDPILFKCYASFFNPDIEVKCLKSPPRKSKDEICCRWEFIGGQ
ncbi:DUF6125 family protein [Chloroflexota bacterium]